MTLSQFVRRIEESLPQQPSWRVLAIAQYLRPQLESGDLASIDVKTISGALVRLHSLEEQLAAVAEDLDLLASTEPQEFEPAHIWTLIRAIKVQSSMLETIYAQETSTESSQAN